MPNRVLRPALVGVSLGPERGHAVVVQGATVRPVASVPGGTQALSELLRACVRAADGGPRAVSTVTVDLSPLLLDAVLRDDALLPRVAAIRIVPRPAVDPVLAVSTPTLERLVGARFTVRGGHDLLGAELTPLDHHAVDVLCAELVARHFDAVALVGAGSQAQPAHERAVADAVLAAVPSARVAAASDYGGHGLAAREATVLLDGALAGLTDRLVERCEQAVAAAVPGAAVRVARGDGGSCAPFYVRTLPAITLGAQDGLPLVGAAHEAGHADCRVLLPGPVTGEVRGGLPVIRSAELGGVLSALGAAVAMPTAVLVAGESPAPRPELAVVRPDRTPVELACIGAAVSRPTAWLDEVGHIATGEELTRTRRRLEQRATAIVLANGAAPGSPQIAHESAVAMPYSPSGTVRLRVRVVGELEGAA